MEPGHGIFSEQDKDNTKALREAEMAVRRDNREFIARRDRSIKGRGRGGRPNRSSLPPRRNPFLSQSSSACLGF